MAHEHSELSARICNAELRLLCEAQLLRIRKCHPFGKPLVAAMMGRQKLQEVSQKRAFSSPDVQCDGRFIIMAEES